MLWIFNTEGTQMTQVPKNWLSPILSRWWENAWILPSGNAGIFKSNYFQRCQYSHFWQNSSAISGFSPPSGQNWWKSAFRDFLGSFVWLLCWMSI